MTCRNFEMLVQKSLDGPLSKHERDSLDAHAAVCPACESAWEDHRRLTRASTAWVRQGMDASESDDAFAAQVMARIAARPSAATHSPRPFWLVAIFLISLLAALLAGSGLISLGAVVPYPDLLLAPQALSAFPGWLTALLHGLPSAGQDLLAGFSAQSSNLSAWAGPVLLSALLLNGLLFHYAKRHAGRRLAE